MLVNAAFVPPAAVLAELAPVVQADRLVCSPPDVLMLPITGFGNLTSGDAFGLARQLSEAAAEWSPPTVWFAGGGALEFPGDPSVWARLDGDVDGLTAIARGVTRAVERLGLFVDRRLFRPSLAVATVTTATIGPDLDDVVGRLEAFRGQEWVVDSIVLTTSPLDGRSPVAEYQRVQIGQPEIPARTNGPVR